jgi:hypothetical protein
MTDTNRLVDYNIKYFDEPSSYVLDNHKVGQLGTIPLDLCTNCMKKFDVNTLESKRSPEMKMARERIGRQFKNE